MILVLRDIYTPNEIKCKLVCLLVIDSNRIEVTKSYIARESLITMQISITAGIPEKWEAKKVQKNTKNPEITYRWLAMAENEY